MTDPIEKSMSPPQKSESQSAQNNQVNGWRSWMKRHQTMVSIASALLVVISYQFSQASKNSQSETGGLALPPARETMPPAAGGQPWPQQAPSALPGSALPASKPATGGQSPGPWPTDASAPTSARPWPNQDAPNPAAEPIGQSGQQSHGSAMAWFDDAGNRWDIALSPDGQFSGRNGNGQPYTLRGSISKDSLTYSVLDGNGQSVGQATGVMQDPTHLAVKISDSAGRLLHQGKLHINHPPSR